MMLRHRKLLTLILIVGLLVSVGACGTLGKLFGGKPLTVSGETLDATSVLFKSWSTESASYCALPRPMTRDAYCNKSADFQGYFKPTFDQASKLWRVAAEARIKALESKDPTALAEAEQLKKAAEAPIDVLTTQLRRRVAEGK